MPEGFGFRGYVMMPRTTTLAMLVAILTATSGPVTDSASAHSDHVGHASHADHGFAAGEPGAQGEPARTVKIVMSDENGIMAFTPSTIEVAQGEQVRFVLENVGTVDHEFLIDSVANNAAHKQAMAANPEMQHSEPNGRRLAPGETTELVWRFTKPGSFEIACLIPGHYELGMKGAVTVK